MTGPENAIEFFHGYTYSGHPMAAAVGNTVLQLMREEGLVARARALEPVLEDAIHSLKGEPGITDIRSVGLAAAIDLEPLRGAPGLRGLKIFEAALDQGQLLRVSGDTIAVAPPFIAEPREIARVVEVLLRLVRTH
jgi:beta-alanine--pyruvate transaminase